jgi:hypothetical protein
VAVEALPFEVVADDRGVAAWCPGAADHWQQRGAAFAPEHQHRAAPAGVPAADVLAGDAELAADLGLGAAGGNS